MESERVAVDHAVFTEWYVSLADTIRDVPRRFVFNVDETGCPEFSDRREQKVIVPSDFRGNATPLPVDRHSKRSTLTACIAADGSLLRPFVIVDRVTIERDVLCMAYDQSTVCIVSQANAFMTHRPFELWAETVFFPAVEERRRQFRYDGTVVLILDGLSAQHTPAFREGCESRNIKLVLLVPHSSDQTQPLDLLTFSLFKHRFSTSRFSRLPSPQWNKIRRMLAAWFCASANHLTVEAFMRMGVLPEERDGDFYLAVKMDEARRVRQWPDLEPGPLASLPQDAHRRVHVPTG
jgi:hypothetical protein